MSVYWSSTIRIRGRVESRSQAVWIEWWKSWRNQADLVDQVRERETQSARSWSQHDIMRTRPRVSFMIQLMRLRVRFKIHWVRMPKSWRTRYVSRGAIKRRIVEPVAKPSHCHSQRSTHKHILPLLNTHTPKTETRWGWIWVSDQERGGATNVMTIIHGTWDRDESCAQKRTDDEPSLEGMTSTIKEMNLSSKIESQETKSTPSRARVTRWKTSKAINQNLGVERSGTNLGVGHSHQWFHLTRIWLTSI